MKKMRFIILALSACLCIVVFFGWNKLSEVNKEAENVIGSETYVNSENYFESAKYSRDRVRAEAVSALKALLQDEKTEEASRIAAEEDISNYAKSSELEAKIESLVVAKGFEECVAFVGEDNVSIVVEKKLSSEDAAKIIDIAVSETGFPSSTVKIIELQEEKSTTSETST